MILMADAVDPSGIPKGFREDRNRGVAPYGDGRFEWHRLTERSFPRRLAGIDVTGETPETCDALDVERYDATAEEWPGWRHQRVEHLKAQGQHDGTGWPIVYCSINPGPPYGVAQVVAATEAAQQRPVERWWIAWYPTIDQIMLTGKPSLGQYNGAPIPSKEAVLAEIKKLTGIVLEPGTLWACQFASFATFDASIVYQDPQWTANHV